MFGSRKLWWAALGLAFVASTFGAQSIAADSEGQGAPVLNVLANLPVGFEPPVVSNKKAALPTKPIQATAKTKIPPVTPPPAHAWPTPARFFTINQVLAKASQGKHDTPGVQLASINPSLTETDAPSDLGIKRPSNEPFGLFTFKAPEGRLSLKWQGVQSEVAAEAGALVRCEQDTAHCSAGEARFTKMLKQADALSGKAKVEFINRKVNEAIHYTSDIAQWGVPDLWSPPVTTDGKGSFDTGLGDCEDYAIAKYVALKASGVAATDLRVLLVRDRTVGMDHAILATHQDGHWMLLDNRWDRLIQDSDATQFVPLFALNEDGVKLIAAPYASLSNSPTLPEVFGRQEASEDTMPSWGLAPEGDAEGGSSTLPLLM